MKVNSGGDFPQRTRKARLTCVHGLYWTPDITQFSTDAYIGSRNAFRPIVQEKNCNRLQVIKWTRVIKNIIYQFIFRLAFAMVNLKLVRCRSICKGSRPQLQPNQWWLFQNQAFARCTLLISGFGWTYLKPSPCNKLSVAIVKVPDLLSLNDCEMYLY